MHRISSLEELSSFRLRVLDKSNINIPCLVISAGTCGQASGANDIMRIVKRQILERNLHGKISLRVTGCQGFCEMNPFILVEPGQNLYPKLKMHDVPRIIDAVLLNEVVEDLVYREANNQSYHCKNDIPFFQKQTRTVLGQNEKLDPIRIYDYIKAGGYAALEKVMSYPEPEWIIEEIKKSGLRGRGGAGFPTGKKWQMAKNFGKKNAQKFLVCNADEGDPGAYMDRGLLEGNPHSIVEGMIIGGIAIGATRGFIYVRSEYPLAIKHALIAIRHARDYGFLGKNILGTGIDFDIEIVRGAGAFVCGEETALIHSIEGKIGEPRQRPPYPIEKGIWGCPTCINNVETLANIPVIIEKGAAKYAKVGVSGSTGTKIFSLVGKIKNTGLVEVPMGITLREIIYDIGGGAIGDAKIKAVQTGGPSGGCIPARMFDLPIDYDTLNKVGSIMGSGGMIVMDNNTCMVDVAKYFMKFLKDESCGKCYTCRKGIQRMYEILEDITEGRASMEDLELLSELAQTVKDTTMCGLGQTAANPVLSTLRYFHNEYIEHIKNKHCSAGVCKNIVGAACQSACPLGTEVWRYIAHIQRAEYEAAYRVIRSSNPFPSICARVCNHPCEDKCKAGATGTQPISIRALKRFVTDRIDPELFTPIKRVTNGKDMPKVAVIGSGPAGLTAAHHLSLFGYKVTLFERDTKPGGMLISAIPTYRLPHEIVEKEIALLIDDNVTLQCNTKLGRDITIDGLFDSGFQAIFIAIGAHKSRDLNVASDDITGILPALEFLQQFNLCGEVHAKGRVGIIGGGNSAIDAARVALRQEHVDSVTVFYRRTRNEMPAYEEEIIDALAEGVKIETLVAPIKVHSENGKLTGLDLIKNRLGEIDASGRRKPVTIPGTEYNVKLDTLLVAIGEYPDTDSVSHYNITDKQKIIADKDTLLTNRDGVFAGGDVVTGPNTVVDAIAAGKKAAIMIDRYLSGAELIQPVEIHLPDVYIEPLPAEELESPAQRVHADKIDPQSRCHSFQEVDAALSVEAATREAGRCLRCDLEFTKRQQTGGAK